MLGFVFFLVLISFGSEHTVSLMGCDRTLVAREQGSNPIPTGHSMAPQLCNPLRPFLIFLLGEMGCVQFDGLWVTQQDREIGGHGMQYVVSRSLSQGLKGSTAL